MANEKWSQKPLITEISNTTEFCILDEAIPKNKRINAKALLDAKANSSTLSSHTSNTDNPHSVTKTQVGLGNVDNTSDASKPISIAQQIALDLKAPKENAAFTGTMTLNGNPVTTNDLNGSNYVMVYGVGNSTENAAELQAAYDAAKLMLPTINNVITVVVAPGRYDFGATAFVHDTQYIDITSLTGEADVIMISSEKELTSHIGIKVTANDSTVKSINCETLIFKISNLPKLVCVNCTGGNFSFGGYGTASGTFTNCTGGASSFGSTASGTFINCKGGVFSFGGSGTASGIFKDCIGGDNSFGRIAPGTFKDCKGGMYSFGSGTAEGTFTNCIGGDNSFGRGYYASGTFINCIGGYNSFGGGDNGTASGTFTNCTGGEGSFGGGVGGILYGTIINCKINGVLFTHSNKEIDLIVNDDGIFQNIKLDGQGYTPVAHPNYSTQATILPQKFGNQLVYQKVIIMTNPNLGVLSIPPLISYDDSIIPLSANIISVKGYYGQDEEIMGRKGVIVLTSGNPTDIAQVNILFYGDADGGNKCLVIIPSSQTLLRELCLIIEYTIPASEYGY